MAMEFHPKNPIVQLCLQGLALEEKGAAEKGEKLFLQAWDQAAPGFEKFISAYFLARVQKNTSEKLKWLETALQMARQINEDSVRSSFPVLFSSIAKCNRKLNRLDEAEKNESAAASFDVTPSEKGPFYHGTKADLQPGDLLTAGGVSNYKIDFKMNHIYFTASVNGAGLAAELAKGDNRGRVYIVEPTGPFENDPNVTNNKFPGNLTRSYRSEAPLKIVGEVKDWTGQTSEEIEKWRKKLAASKGEIIN
jgi:rifampin ADP-ribosylating transferase